MSSQVKLLAINLKHLYQRRGCWFLSLFFLFFPLMIFGDISKPQNLLDSILFSSFFMNVYGGVFVGGMLNSIVAKPFSVCLPEYRKVFPRIIFFIGLLLNFCFIALLIVIAQCFVMSFFAIFSFGMFTYISFAVSTLKRFKAVILLILGFVGFYGFLCFSQQTWSFWIFLEKNSLSVSIVLLAVCWLCVRKLNAARICEKFCDVPAMDMFSVWNMEKARQIAEYKNSKRNDRLSFGIAALLEKLMRSTSTLSAKYGYGLAIIGSGFTVINLWALLVWLVVVMVFCYMPVEGFPVRVILFIIPAFFSIQLANAVRIPLLCACGRKERFVLNGYAVVVLRVF